jgi:Tol biopolymer transport system component
MISIGDGEIRALTYPSGAAHHDGGRFSPDGTKLAFVSCVLEACEIDVVDVGPGYAPVGAPRRLTPRAVGHGGLAWTRDGKSIVYGDTIDKRLWRVEVDGGQPPERIEMAGWPVGRPTTARSRDRLAFVRLAEQRDIYRFEVGSAPEVVTASSYDDFNPQFSPDGRRIAFESSRRGETHDIWLSDPDGSSATQLTHGPGRWQGSPRWSPDGRQIAFDSMDEAGRWDIWVTDAAGGAPRRITSDPANDNMPSWSRDGRFIYFGSLRGGAANIWRAPVGGGPPELVTSGLGPAYEALDGKTLYVSPGGPSPLMAVPTTGGPQRQVVDCVPVWGFAVGPAGIYHLSCAGWPHGRSLHVLDPVTERDQLLGKLERALGGISVSPNGKSILYTRVTGQGSDLALIENFR